MSENKVKTNLDAIEKLIVDGQKEVIKRIEAVEGRVGLVDGRLVEIDETIGKLDKKIDSVHSSLKNEIKVTGLAIKEDIQRVETKLDSHLKQPAHA